jgi:GNAT superfamily N-acetyltransferase
MPSDDATASARAPWLLHADAAPLTVRGAQPHDLPGVAMMHGRCSPKSLLDRYRTGGLPPAVLVLDRHVRDPLSFVVTTENNRIVALARLVRDAIHPFSSAEVSVLVEDQWQHLGIGQALLRHCADAAVGAGYRQLISYPGTTAGAVQRMMSALGTTRLMTDGSRHLHTAIAGYSAQPAATTDQGIVSSPNRARAASTG